MARLLFLRKSQPSFEYYLKKETNIGRAKNNDIILPDEDISTRHCHLESKGNEILLTDLSTNGVFVRGNRIEKNTKLKIGDDFQIGDWEIKIFSEETKSLPKTVIRHPKKTKILKYKPKEDTLLAEEIHFKIIHAKKDWLHKVSQLPVLIGISPHAGLVIQEDEYVSREHCLLYEKEGKYYLEDLKSSNGTLFQGRKITSVVLPSHGEFEIGRSKIEYWIKEAKKEIATVEPFEIPPYLVANDPKMLKMLSLVKAVAPSDVTILLEGETGVGKEEIAHLLHIWSNRSEKPYIAINCATSTVEVLENTLFGHEKGAFTGASETKPGLFEEANGGTLFLDEIGEMPLSVQATLLRVLETGTVRRLGSSKKEIKTDVRVIAGTNKNLKIEIANKQFRQDLYYRLNPVEIFIPPLRERSEEIPKLIEKILQKHDKAPKKTFAPEAVEKLTSYSWPGNIRQLSNYILRILYDPSVTSPVCAKDIHLEDFDTQSMSESFIRVREEMGPGFKPMTLDEARRLVIIGHIRAFPKDTVDKLAERIGVSRPNLNKMMRKYRIDINQERARSLNKT